MDYSFTACFESKVLTTRPYLTREMCIRVVENPVRAEPETGDERVRFSAAVPELRGRMVRVVTLADRRTIHNAFLDRGFRP